MRIWLIDVKTFFLYGRLPLTSKVYMQPFRTIRLGPVGAFNSWVPSAASQSPLAKPKKNLCPP